MVCVCAVAFVFNTLLLFVYKNDLFLTIYVYINHNIFLWLVDSQPEMTSSHEDHNI